MKHALSLAYCSFLALAACGGESNSAPASSPTGENAAVVTTDPIDENGEDPTETEPAHAEGEIAEAAPADPIAEGKRAFAVCAVCHKVEDGERSLVGPNLYGIVGRSAGAVEDFTYTSNLRESGIVWTEENLNAFIENPRALIPGNRMAYAGESNPERRAAIIAYLKSISPDQ